MRLRHLERAVGCVSDEGSLRNDFLNKGPVLMTIKSCILQALFVLGTLFRRFGNMKGNHLRPEDRVYDDYISAYHPFSATRFQVTAGEKVA